VSAPPEVGERYEAVIGLEVHTELLTSTKLFCGCANEFGAEPNTNICPVCLGLPGALPVLNAAAVECALRLASALAFDVPPRSLFARKNYFYPDMPKDFQISQYEEPILSDGRLDVDGTPVGIERAHIEEDTGKTVHVGGGGRIHEADHSLVDYNRAGVPLMEIVSRPDLRSAEQARAYVTELRAVLRTLDISDVKMEEGSLRVDANVSLRPAGTTALGTKVEIKNMNSLRSLGRAIDFEIARQAELLDRGERVVQETRHWDEADERTHGMRTKEGSSDYRYFPEPDLVPLAPDAEARARVEAALPELPAARRARLVDAWGISAADVRVLVDVEGLADYAEAAAAALTAGTPRDVTHWCTGDLLGWLREHGAAPIQLAWGPARLAELVSLVADGTVSRNQAKEVLVEGLETGRPAGEIIAARGLAQVSDESALGGTVTEVLAAHPEDVAAYREGDEKVRKKKIGFLMGQAIKATSNQGNPQVLRRLLEERLG
jgi:aspartyl-tRNA(Asn)/glutamyl-tRNA(Gln) amidotransferase subunit B